MVLDALPYVHLSIIYLWKIYLFLCVLFLASMYIICMCIIYIPGACGDEKRTSDFLGTTVINGCEWPFCCWELNQGEQSVLLTAELSLQSQLFIFLKEKLTQVSCPLLNWGLFTCFKLNYRRSLHVLDMIYVLQLPSMLWVLFPFPCVCVCCVCVVVCYAVCMFGVLCICARVSGGVHALQMHVHSEAREVCQGSCSVTLSLIPLR